MKIVRIVKIPYLIICCLLLIVLWLLSHHHHHHHHHNNNPSYDPIMTIQPESSTLLSLLRTVTMDDRTVIVTMVDREWAKPGSILDIFLESVRIGVLRTKHLLNHLIVAALDDQALEYCRVVHPHCYLHRDYKRKTQSLNPDGLVNGWEKKELLKEILEFGYNIMFTEADVLWLRNPLTLCNSVHSMSLACGFSSGDQYVAAENTGGFFYIKSNDVTVDLFRTLNVERFVYPATQNQSICTIVKRQDVIEGLDMKVTYIGEAKFGRFCQKNPQDPSKISTVHASCCKDTHKKVHYLKLILQDWKNMNLNVQDSSSRWRIPSQC